MLLATPAASAHHAFSAEFDANKPVKLNGTVNKVEFLDEAIHDVRMVPLDGRPHIGKDIRHWNGDSHGRWEGNTLVIETTNYGADHFHEAYPSTAWPSSDQLRAIERYTLTAPDILELRFTIDDAIARRMRVDGRHSPLRRIRANARVWWLGHA